MDGTTQTSALITQVSTPAPTPALNAAQPAPGLDWTTIIVAVVTGVTTGIVAPIVSPYMKWYFARKERLENENKKIVKELRNAVTDTSNSIDDVFSHEYFPHVGYRMGAKWESRLDSLKSESDFYKHQIIRHEMIQTHNIDIDAEMTIDESIKASKLWNSYIKTVEPGLLPQLMTDEYSEKIKLLILRAIAVLEREWGLVGK